MLQTASLLLRRITAAALIVGAVWSGSARGDDFPADTSTIWSSTPQIDSSWRAADAIEAVFEAPSDDGVISPTPVTFASSSISVPEAEESDTLSETQLSADVASDDLQRLLGRMAWITVGLGIAGLASLVILKMWFSRGVRRTAAPAALRVLESVKLNPRCGLYLVQAESHRVLIGVDQGKTMSLQVLPSSFAESLHEVTEDDPPADTDLVVSAGPFERVSDALGALQGGSLWSSRRSA